MWSPTERLQFDARPCPIVVITFHDRWSAEDLVWMFGQFDLLFKSGRRYALVVDTTRATNSPNARERKLITDWELRCAAEVERLNVGVAVVFTSAIIRGCLTALGWLVRRSKPVVYLPTAAEAGRWCVDRLLEAQEPLTVEARGYLLTRGVELG
jgi:hypothetical protein